MDELIKKEKNTELVLKTENALAKTEETLQIWTRSHSCVIWENVIIGGQYLPLRRMRQISAEIQQKKNAMHEAKYKVIKNKKTAEIKRSEAAKETDQLKKDLLLIEAEELEANISLIEKPYIGAMRDVLELTELHDALEKQIKEKYGKLDEEVFEKEEVRYWIIRSFSQSIRNVRQCGVISSGEQELLEQLGFDPNTVQKLLKDFLAVIDKECNMSNESLINFLEDCSIRFEQVVYNRLKQLGFDTVNKYEHLHRG